MRRLAAGIFVLLLAACSGDGADSVSTTVAVTSTTLRSSPTTSSLPPRGVTEVDVCNLLEEDELATVVDDPGPGEVTITQFEGDPGEAPSLLTGQCAWPTVADAELTLYYLAPTTAESGRAHLQDVVELEPEFARDAAINEVEIGCCTFGMLIDRDGKLREVAVVRGSALLYLVVNQDVDGRDTEATNQYAELLAEALIRAPR
jgi:hypothetical protein